MTEFFVACLFKGHVQAGPIVPCVINPTGCRMVRELVFGNQIFPPKLCWVHVQLFGQHVYNPLRLEIQLLATVSSIGSRGTFVGHDHVDIPIQIPYGIGPQLISNRTVRASRLGAAQIPSYVVHDFLPDAQNRTVVFGGSLDIRNPVSSAGGGHEVFHPVLNIFHRNSCLLGG